MSTSLVRRALIATIVPAILVLGIVAINQASAITVTTHDDWDDTDTVRTLSDSDVTTLWKAAESGELVRLNPVYRFLAVIGYIAAWVAILTSLGMGLLPKRRVLRVLTVVAAFLGLLVPLGYMRLAKFAVNYSRLGGNGDVTVHIGAGPLFFGIACLAAAVLAMVLPHLLRRTTATAAGPAAMRGEAA